MTNITKIPDHFDRVASELLAQFKGKPNLENLLQVFTDEVNELEDTFIQLLEDRSIDTAVGAQLDIIGEIVGLGRVVEDITKLFFGFQGATPTPGAFGDENDDPITGGTFRTEGEATSGQRTLSDTEYRIAIKGKIYRNVSSGTPNEIIKQLQFQLNFDDITIEDNPSGDAAKVRVGIGRPLTATETELVTVQGNVATPAGVEIEFFTF